MKIPNEHEIHVWFFFVFFFFFFLYSLKTFFSSASSSSSSDVSSVYLLPSRLQFPRPVPPSPPPSDQGLRKVCCCWGRCRCLRHPAGFGGVEEAHGAWSCLTSKFLPSITQVKIYIVLRKNLWSSGRNSLQLMRAFQLENGRDNNAKPGGIHFICPNMFQLHSKGLKRSTGRERQ